MHSIYKCSFISAILGHCKLQATGGSQLKKPQNPFEVGNSICEIRGNVCNLCLGHCHEGDKVCPNGHHDKQKYTGITCVIVVGLCSVCKQPFGQKRCIRGHVQGKTYYPTD